MVEVVPVVIGGVFTLAGGGVFFYGFNRMSKYRLIADTPTSKIRSMAMGIVEINGQVVGNEYIKTPFSQTDCTYYKYIIKEYRQHVSRDSKGNTHTSYSWDVVAQGERRIPFFAKDDTGQVYVEPTGAEFNVLLKKVFLQKAGLFGAINTIVGALKNWDNPKTGYNMDVRSWNLSPLPVENEREKMTLRTTFGNTVGDRKYYEYFVEPNEKLYILGTAANQGKSVLIKKGENEKTFIISDRSEKALTKNLKWQMIGCFIGGALFLIIGILLILYQLGVLG